MADPTPEPAAAAQALLRDFEERYGDGGAPPVPVERVASSLLGLFVDEADDIRTLPGAPADRGRLSGMLDPEEMVVWIDRGEARRSPGRRRFTIAHEIGHLVLHVPALPEAFYDGPGDVREIEEGSPGSKLTGPRRREREANLFARELLMPESLVNEQAHATGFNLPALAKRFEVSVPAMRLRLRLLKLLPPLA
ncbi:MAG TPA: ImmA/IrrE family metallo-endopeptidase [Solirubrobacterales bacterium]|nr:ImmA/IrrE family metallo-endopeptidase [Solirubrobacterales bacterium]